MNERVLVTGATGFLGSHVARLACAQGAHVTVLARRPTAALTALGVKVIEADLRDRHSLRDACRDQDVVHHVGGISGVWGSWGDYYETNTVATEALLASARLHGVGKFIYTSSPSVTFDGTDQVGIDERAPYAGRWLCHYPHSKMLAERSVLAAHGRELLTCALRPHLIWGPGDRHLIPRLLARARAGRLIRVGRGENLVDITYVENAAHAQLLAAEKLTWDSPLGGRPFFISQGEPVNCWDWIDEILVLAGLAPLRRSISASLAWHVGSLLEGVHRLCRLPGEPAMTRFVAAQLSTSHYFNIDAARRDLGYLPLVSTEEGLRRLANWLRKG